MTVETRYFGYDLVLDTTKVGVQGDNSKTDVGVGGYLGIRVFKVKDSVETEITAGTPVAQIPCNDGDVKQRKSNTWDCPETTDFDFIRVKVYCKIGSQAWALMDTWNTESLSGKKLEAATWTVYYVEDCSVNTRITPFRTTITFYYDGTNDSEIDNFTWTPAVAVVKKPLMDGLVFVE
jgi:hypothetical protein